MADGGDAGAAASGGDGAAGGNGDNPKKEPKGRLSFLTKLNPFAKESEKEKEEKRAATEQKNKELAEAKKKRDDIEKEKGNREEAKESSRLAAKREKYQRLLQKNPDTTKRVFQFRMKAIKLEALTQERLSSYLRIMVGGDYTEREVPGKGLVKMTVPPACKCSPRRIHFPTGARQGSRQERNQERGAVQDARLPAHRHERPAALLQERVRVRCPCVLDGLVRRSRDGGDRDRGEPSARSPRSHACAHHGASPRRSPQVFQSFTAKKGKKRCGEKLSLLQLAQGSVMKEFVLKDEKKDGGGSESAKAGGAHHGALFRVSFVVYFEELFVFQLRFVEWKGVGLIAADTPKKRKRSAKSEELEAKRKAKIEAAREAFKLRLELKRKQKVRSRRTRVRE